MIPIAPRPDAVAKALAAENIRLDAGDIIILERDGRFLVPLPGDGMAVFPLDAAGAEKLALETHVLDLLADHCAFLVPRIIRTMPAGWQLRLAVPGTCDPFSVYERVKADRGFARAIGHAMGRVLADQHAHVPRPSIEGLLQPRPSWPPPRAQIEPGLRRHLADTGLFARAMDVIDRLDAFEAAVTDRVLTHSDFGFHNMIVTDTGAITGVFDYDDAACADRHHDFKLLLLDVPDETLLHAALDAYDVAPVDWQTLCVLNAASALGFLAWRGNAAADDKPAGRTLAEDLRWTRLALDRLT